MNKFLFNFSASYSGGGKKRLEEFSKWFSLNGGATFIISKNNSSLIDEFPNNEYIVPEILRIDRILNRENYFKSLINREFVLYYSYSIPITKRIAKLNILHISNVLPFVKQSFDYNFIEKSKFLLLKYYFLRCLNKVDVLSAESKFSISLFKDIFKKQMIVSKNGSDEEISYFKRIKELNLERTFDDYAVVLGTHKHKCVDDSYQIFKLIQAEENLSKLKIIGPIENLSNEILKNPNIEVLGVMNRSDIFELLSNAKVYISTTKIENSFNAASEAIFVSKKSFISTIQPHYELLSGLKFKVKNFRSLGLEMFEIESKQIDIRNLESWNTVIENIIQLRNDA